MEEKEKKNEELEKTEKEKKKKPEEKLPYCDTAPSAEQARASADDEPCDDGRSGNME
ncbi:hypothetical protein ACFL7M_12990 [Thermodesulfobacteriota bacterium]